MRRFIPLVRALTRLLPWGSFSVFSKHDDDDDGDDDDHDDDGDDDGDDDDERQRMTNGVVDV